MAAVLVPVAAALTAGEPSLAASNPLAGSSCCSTLVMATPAGLWSVPSGEQYVVSAEPADTVVLSASTASRSGRRALPVGVARETGLQVDTILTARAVSAVFPEITEIGGVRADYLKWHPNGLAIDVMIPGYDTEAGRALGNQIVAFALANFDRFRLDHVIWRQVIWSRRGAPRAMRNSGSDDANHLTHVHIATVGGGFPTGGEAYFR